LTTLIGRREKHVGRTRVHLGRARRRCWTWCGGDARGSARCAEDEDVEDGDVQPEAWEVVGQKVAVQVTVMAKACPSKGRAKVAEAGAAAADVQSTVRHAAAEAEGQVATLLGPLAMCNAACALCANLRFTGLGTHRGARTLGVRTARFIGAHEQMCVYYKPRIRGAVCVLCEEPIH
jgi:hypothetical protein